MCVLEFNNTIICYGHHYWDLTLGRYGDAWVNITLPITYPNYYTAFTCSRNQGETIASVVQPDNSSLNIVAHSVSAENRYTYGMYWMTVGL